MTDVATLTHAEEISLADLRQPASSHPSGPAGPAPSGPAGPRPAPSAPPAPAPKYADALIFAEAERILADLRPARSTGSPAHAPGATDFLLPRDIRGAR